jgi:transposase
LKLGPYRELIDSWLVADREAPPKQRHTARRVFERLGDEHGVVVSERQVRRCVRRRRREPGEAFVRQLHEPGSEAEVDWGEAQVRRPGVARLVR